jgi:tetratricopeptide (TPR) repeat protein
MNTTTDYLPELMLQLREAADPQAAIQLLANAADTHPADARPLVLLAAELMECGHVDRAEAAYSAALLRAPEFWIARFQLGLLQFTSARPAMALVTWAPLDSLEPGDPLRIFKNSLELLAKGDLAQSQTLMREGIAANTVNQPLNRDMQMLLEQISTDQGLKHVKKSAGATETTDSHFLVSAYKGLH